MLVLLGTEFPYFFCIYCETPLIVLFTCFLRLIKEDSVAAVNQPIMVKWRHNILSTSLLSTSTDGWSTAGVADSKYIKVLIL